MVAIILQRSVTSNLQDYIFQTKGFSYTLIKVSGANSIQSPMISMDFIWLGKMGIIDRKMPMTTDRLLGSVLIVDILIAKK